MLANVLDSEDVAILDAAISANPTRQAPSRVDPVTPPRAERELSVSTGLGSARGATLGLLAGATFWLVVLAVFIGH